MEKYKIIRFSENGKNRVLRKVGLLTLEEAKRYCSRPETKGKGWFCGFTKV